MDQSCVLVQWKGALHEKPKLLNRKLRRSELFGNAWVHCSQSLHCYFGSNFYPGRPKFKYTFTEEGGFQKVSLQKASVQEASVQKAGYRKLVPEIKSKRPYPL